MYPKEMQERMMREMFKEKLRLVTRGNPGWETNIRRYGQTAEFFLGLLIEQEFCCGICVANLEIVEWDIDHCHTLDDARVRGALCKSCNTWLGKREGMIKQAWRYLKLTKKEG